MLHAHSDEKSCKADASVPGLFYSTIRISANVEEEPGAYAQSFAGNSGNS